MSNKDLGGLFNVKRKGKNDCKLFEKPSFFDLRKYVKKPNLDELRNDELQALYDKMDKHIEEEGQQRRALGSYDEMYILELSIVKDRLLKEIKRKSKINT